MGLHWHVQMRERLASEMEFMAIYRYTG